MFGDDPLAGLVEQVDPVGDEAAFAGRGAVELLGQRRAAAAAHAVAHHHDSSTSSCVTANSSAAETP